VWAIFRCILARSRPSLATSPVRRALLLCAGLGTRLRPITNDIPKCLVPILGRPLLSYWLEMLVDAGVDQIMVNTHHFSDRVVEFVRNSQWSKYVTIVYEPELLGTGGTAIANREFFVEQPFILAHADNLTRFSVQDFVNRHVSRPKGCEMTMMLFRTDAPETCGIVEMDSRGVVQKFHEKVENPPGDLANGAVYIFEPSVLDYMQRLGESFVDLSTEVIPVYLGKIATFENSVYHRDIGNPTSFKLAEKEFAGILIDATSPDGRTLTT
jgi:mannose-1-phosphate guanylyltransferase